MIIDKDLLSIQDARILAENAFEAQKKLATFSQEKLDLIVDDMAQAIEVHLEELAVFAEDETDIGRWQDKLIKTQFICSWSRAHLQGMRCVGVINHDHRKNLTEIGVPVGVIVATCSETSPVSTTLYNALIAIKSGNAIIFTPQPRAHKTIAKALDILIAAATKSGLPEGCLDYLNTIAPSGISQLFHHPSVSLILITDDDSFLEDAEGSGKTIIFGGTGNGPAFIERTADIAQAAKDIVVSKTFDHGVASSAEQSIVVDAPVAELMRQELIQNGAHFMSSNEAERVANLFFNCSNELNKNVIGIAAYDIAQQAGFTVPRETTLLIAERLFVSEKDPYFREFLAPVLALYVEQDWKFACEKCIELLLFEKSAHTLVIHSKDEDVIHQFALKKPVARLLVNTPGAFGGIGATTNLFPSMILGSSSAGRGITSDNVSPFNLIYRRKVGYHARDLTDLKNAMVGGVTSHPFGKEYNIQNDSDKAEDLQDIVSQVLDTLKGS